MSGGAISVFDSVRRYSSRAASGESSIAAWRSRTTTNRSALRFRGRASSGVSGARAGAIAALHNRNARRRPALCDHCIGIDLAVELRHGLGHRAGARIGRHADLDQRSVELIRGRPVSVAVRVPNTRSQECNVISTLLALQTSLSTLTEIIWPARADFRFAVEKFRQQLLGGRADQWRIFADQGGERQGAAAVSRLRASGRGTNAKPKRRRRPIGRIALLPTGTSQTEELVPQAGLEPAHPCG